MLRVSEIFKSIQGESTYVGLPCVFVRLTGCNLRCSYCDTRYAYRGGRDLNVSKVLTAVQYFRCRLVELTGGEPLLQEDAPVLVRMLLDKGHDVLVETNGSVSIRDLDRRSVAILDIKCPGSGESGKVCWDNLKALRPHDEVKFVVTSKKDYDWAKRVIEDKVPRRQTVLVSPAFGKVRPERLAGWILKDGLRVRMQLQLQKLIWPDKKRGV